MSVSVEEALESAIIAAVGADAGVRELLGNPMRVEELGAPRPAFPYLEVVRHETRPAGSLGVEASEHFVDFAVVSRDLGGKQARAAMSAIQGVLLTADIDVEGHACVLMLPVFMDVTRTRPGLWRAMIRIRAVIEPV